VIGKRKVGKHFITGIGGGRFAFRRDEEKITAEACACRKSRPRL
jgi:hypothetical protein